MAALQAADELHAPSRELVCLQFCCQLVFFAARLLCERLLNEKPPDIVKVGMRKIVHHQIGASLLEHGCSAVRSDADTLHPRSFGCHNAGNSVLKYQYATRVNLEGLSGQ